MRFALLVLLVALVIVMVVFLAKERQASPGSETLAPLDKAKSASLEPILRQVQAALDAYDDENGEPASDLDALLPRFLANADMLVDPWGTRLILEKDALGGAFLVCAGPDRAFATADDIRRSL
jgi:hypothetical protein